MRANYALENTVQPLKDSIQNALDEMLSELAQEVGIHKNDIYQIAVVGNTCMHHLFLGISPASLVHAPYTPAIRQSLVLRASAYGLHVHPKAQLLLLSLIHILTVSTVQELDDLMIDAENAFYRKQGIR